MKRLIHREIQALSTQIINNKRIEDNKKVELEYQKLIKDPLYKTMKKRARLLDAFLFMGENDIVEKILKHNLMYRAEKNAKVTYINSRDVYDTLVIAQIDAKDLTDLTQIVKNKLNF